jgi:hypothetical protein
MNIINRIIDTIYYKPKRRKAFQQWEKDGAKNETE